MKRAFMAASVDPEKVSALLRECAKEYILPYFRNLSKNDIQIKNDKTQSKVTIADHKSESFMIKGLMEILPESFVVGEEGAYDNEAALEHLQDPEKLVWVLDSIDGTGNFSRGSEIFCMMLALVKSGKTQMAWIYDVCTDSMAFAETGKGVFIDGERVLINQDTPLEGAKGFTRSRFSDQVKNVEIKTLGCVGHEYLTILKNKAVFGLYSFMQPWDHAAGTFMVEEAGGHVAKWDGSPYSAKDRKGGIIAANSHEIWLAVKNAIPHKALRKHGVKL